jgi:dienelactone hydrolase
MRTVALAVVLGLMTPAFTQEPSIKTEVIDYKDGDVALQGYMAWNPAVSGKRPGIMIIHEWKGHGDYVRRRADQLARLGYVAFAADMYGKGVFAKDHAEAGKLAGAFFNDRKHMRDRAKAGFEVLLKNPLCDPKRAAAMGYCFGGTTALEMARAGMDLRGAASFHGNLSTANAADAKNIKGKVIVFHGLEDPHVKEEVVKAFHEEMKAAKVDYQFVGFGGAVHGFTVKEAGDDPSGGIAYNEKADRRSWSMLESFLKEIFS